MIIFTFKGTIRYVSQSPHCAANFLQHYATAAWAQLCANLVQHMERLARATCRVPRGTKGQLRCQVWQSWNNIYFSFVLLAEPLTNA